MGPAVRDALHYLKLVYIQASGYEQSWRKVARGAKINVEPEKERVGERVNVQTPEGGGLDNPGSFEARQALTALSDKHGDSNGGLPAFLELGQTGANPIGPVAWETWTTWTPLLLCSVAYVR